MAATEDLRLEFTTATTLNVAEGEGETGAVVHMQPFVRNGDRWKKAGVGLIADSVRDHLRIVDFAIENDQLHKVLDPKAHLGEEAVSDA